MAKKKKAIARVLLAVLMMGIGAAHFANPRSFLQIMPGFIPTSLHLPLVQVSGAFEILGGAGILVPKVRALAGWGLVALYLAVFPANINMAVNRLPMGDAVWPVWALWARLPLQLVLIAWAYWVSRPDAPDARVSANP